MSVLLALGTTEQIFEYEQSRTIRMVDNSDPQYRVHIQHTVSLPSFYLDFT